jgi:hypothetical protein
MISSLGRNIETMGKISLKTLANLSSPVVLQM